MYAICAGRTVPLGVTAAPLTANMPWVWCSNTVTLPARSRLAVQLRPCMQQRACSSCNQQLVTDHFSIIMQSHCKAAYAAYIEEHHDDANAPSTSHETIHWSKHTPPSHALWATKSYERVCQIKDLLQVFNEQHTVLQRRACSSLVHIPVPHRVGCHSSTYHICGLPPASARCHTQAIYCMSSVRTPSASPVAASPFVPAPFAACFVSRAETPPFPHAQHPLLLIHRQTRPLQRAPYITILPQHHVYC